MTKSTTSQVIVSIIWGIILAVAIVFVRVLPIDIYYKFSSWVVVLFTFLTSGIRVLPYFQNGIIGLFKRIFSSSSDAEDIETGEQSQDDNAQQRKKQNQQKKSNKKRIYFLDYVKTFLTFIVVYHHTLGSFLVSSGMPIQIGYYENIFSFVAAIFLGLNQSYFMPLFFFISAYFTPKSYDRKGKDLFLSERGKRLFIPAIAVTFGLWPLSIVVAQAFTGNALSYQMGQGPTWYIYWLIIFSVAYGTYRIANDYAERIDNNNTETQNNNSENEEEKEHVYPNFWKRWLAGVIICGCLTLLFTLAIGNNIGNPPSTNVGLFYMVPIANNTGSFCHDILFFVMGIFACRRDLLSKPILSSRLSWILLCISTLAEFLFGALVYDYAYAVYIIFMGMYCVDMSTLILAIFQKFADVKPGAVGRFLSSCAYTVYLIHPFFITIWMGAFVKVYNLMYGDVIQFSSGSTISDSPLLGPGNGSLALFIGFLLVLILVNLTVWPAAYCIRSLPVLRDIL